MDFYDLATNLQYLKEDTTMNAISYLPCQVGAIKARFKDLAKEKPDWHIEILEDEGSKTVSVEDRLKIIVPKEHWEHFHTNFKEELGLEEVKETKINESLKDTPTDVLEDELVDLESDLISDDPAVNKEEAARRIKFIKDEIKGRENKNESKQLKEAVEDDMKKLRSELKLKLTEMFNKPEFISVDKIVNVWRSLFGIKSYGITKTVVLQKQKGKDIQRLYGQLLRTYGEDKGNLEMLLNDIDSNRPLNSYDSFKDFDYLYGTRIVSEVWKEQLIFEATIDMSSNVAQSIYIENDAILDAVEEQSKSVKRVGNVLFPVGGKFEASFLKSLKDIVKDTIE
jgi:hypothetical protein